MEDKSKKEKSLKAKAAKFTNKKREDEMWYFIKTPGEEKYTCPACPCYYQTFKQKWTKYGIHDTKYHKIDQNRLRKKLFKIAPGSQQRFIRMKAENCKWTFRKHTKEEMRVKIEMSCNHIFQWTAQDLQILDECYEKFKNIKQKPKIR